MKENVKRVFHTRFLNPPYADIIAQRPPHHHTARRNRRAVDAALEPCPGEDPHAHCVGARRKEDERGHQTR